MSTPKNIGKIFFWRIDYRYKDLGVKTKMQGYHTNDDFASKISIDRVQHWGIANAGGIRILSAGRNGKKDDKLLPAAVFLITSQPASVFHNPWEDSIDYATGTAIYWGDAKYREGYDVERWKGNALLAKIYDLVLRGEYSFTPPILYFVKEKKSEVVFKGLCVIDSLEKTWFEDKGKRVINYRFTLSILNVDRIDPDWLVSRARNGNIDPDDKTVPEAWKRYTRNGYKDKLFVWSKKIKSKEQQRPLSGSPGEHLLRQLEKMHHFTFEKAICNLLETYKGIIHRITQTRNVKDGGFDMEGEFRLPAPFNYPIRFKGEVKRYKKAIGPEYVSRLVARLERGEYGLFFTTGYFTEDAQKEVIEDSYPVRLVCGAELYDFFYEARVLDENGIKESWLKEISK